MKVPPKSPEQTAVGAVRSAVAVHVAGRRWLSSTLGVFKQHPKTINMNQNMKTGIVVLIAFSAVFFPLKSQAILYFSPPTSIVQNGNFESSGGWALSGNGGAMYGFNGGADGGAFIGLDSLNLSPLYQNVPTTSGQIYLLTFYIRGSYPAGQSPPFAVNVFWNSQQVGSFTLNTFSSSWVLESLSVIGGSDSQSRLEFRNPDPTFSELDDVSLVAIPEASSFVAGVLLLLMMVVAAIVNLLNGNMTPNMRIGCTAFLGNQTKMFLKFLRVKFAVWFMENR